MIEPVDVAATLTTEIERFAADMRRLGIAHGLDPDFACLWTFSWLEAIERWRRRMAQLQT